MMNTIDFTGVLIVVVMATGVENVPSGFVTGVTRKVTGKISVREILAQDIITIDSI